MALGMLGVSEARLGIRPGEVKRTAFGNCAQNHYLHHQPQRTDPN